MKPATTKKIENTHRRFGCSDDYHLLYCKNEFSDTTFPILLSAEELLTAKSRAYINWGLLEPADDTDYESLFLDQKIKTRGMIALFIVMLFVMIFTWIK